MLPTLRYAGQDAPVCPSAGRKWIGILTGFPDRDLPASMTGAIADAPGSMILGRAISIVMPQAEGKNLRVHFLERKFVILTHPAVLLDLLILFCRDMNRAVITMRQAPCD